MIRAPQPLLPGLAETPWYRGAPRMTSEPLDLWASQQSAQATLTTASTVGATAMSMTKQHFQAIADTFKGQLEISHSDMRRAGIIQTARDMADTMRRFNSRFDRSRFLAACGLAPEDRQ